METSNIIFLVIAGILLIGVGLCFYFKKDYLKYHNAFSPVISALSTCIKAISGIMPNNVIMKTLAEVLSAAIVATTKAEELWLNSLLKKEERNFYAQNYIEVILNQAGIEITDNIKSIIDGAISFVCYLLPHGREPKETKEEA